MRLLLGVFAGALVLTAVAGCRGGKDPGRPGRSAGSAVIAKGMRVERAREMLGSAGILLKDEGGAYTISPWLVRSAKSRDALMIQPDERTRIERLYLYVDWEGDSRLPKGVRKYVHRRVDKVSIDEVREWVETGTGAEKWSHE